MGEVDYLREEPVPFDEDEVEDVFVLLFEPIEVVEDDEAALEEDVEELEDEEDNDEEEDEEDEEELFVF